jgi:hypothetical protein
MKTKTQPKPTVKKQVQHRITVDLTPVKRDLTQPDTRYERLADGWQVDVSRIAEAAGFQFPIFLTRDVFDGFVFHPERAPYSDLVGFILRILALFDTVIKEKPAGAKQVKIDFQIRKTLGGDLSPVQLIGDLGPLDVDDPRQALTIRLATEKAV